MIEVLSSSSEGNDDGDKRSDFQSLTSLEAYVLVAQDQQVAASPVPEADRAAGAAMVVRNVAA